MDDSGIDMEKEDASRVGVIFGSGVGGLGTMQQQVTRMNEKELQGFHLCLYL